MTADQTFAVEHPKAALAAEFDGELRGDQCVGGVPDDRDLEAVGIELPCGGDVLGRPGPPGRHDVDGIELVSAAGGSAHTDFNDVAHGMSLAGVVVGRFDRHGDVVRVALFEARGGDLDELRLL